MTAFGGVGAIDLLSTAMKVRRESNRLIASNIANIDTPNYTPVELDFQSTLRASLSGVGRVSLRRTQPQHLEENVRQAGFERLALSSKNDYNKVDLDEQVTKLSENTGQYILYGSLLVKQFDQVKNALANLR